MSALYPPPTRVWFILKTSHWCADSLKMLDVEIFLWKLFIYISGRILKISFWNCVSSKTLKFQLCSLEGGGGYDAANVLVLRDSTFKQMCNFTVCLHKKLSFIYNYCILLCYYFGEICETTIYIFDSATILNCHWILKSILNRY